MGPPREWRWTIPVGIFGKVREKDIIGYDDSRGMPITKNYQALQLMETLWEEYSPVSKWAAHKIRKGTDMLEEIANNNPDGIAFKSGGLLFNTMGKVARAMLYVAGKGEEVSNVYAEHLFENNPVSELQMRAIVQQCTNPVGRKYMMMPMPEYNG